MVSYRLFLDSVLCMCFLVLAAVEMSTSITSHCLSLRICTYQTVTLAALTCGDLYFRHIHKRVSRGVVVWQCAIFVAAFGLHFEDILHSVRMLLYQHDQGQHQPPIILNLLLADISLKIINAAIVSVTPDPYIPLTRSSVLAFHLLPPACVMFTFVMIQLDVFVLWLDPLMTFVLCVVMAGLSITVVIKMIPYLLLAEPEKSDQSDLIYDKYFALKFPNCTVHELHAYRLGLHSNTVTAHIRFHQPITDKQLVNKALEELTAYFTLKYNAQNVVLQPEFDLNDQHELTSCEYACKSEECSEMKCCKNRADGC